VTQARIRKEDLEEARINRSAEEARLKAEAEENEQRIREQAQRKLELIQRQVWISCM